MPVRQTALAFQEPELITGLRDTRRAERQAFLVALREPSLNQLLESDEVFVNFVDLGLSDYGIRQGALADALGISTAAVGRWRAGKNVPPVYGRVHILGVMADQLAADLKAGPRSDP